jgi:hydroxyacylglutathione hydrolase
MHVEVLPISGDNYSYLVVDGKHAAAVDPADAGTVLSRLEQADLELDMVLVTHHHSDHTGGCMELRKSTGCSVVGPDDSRLPALTSPVNDGDIFSLGSVEFKALALPGHTRTGMAYYSLQGRAVFTGDTLFCGGCGRLFEGSAAEMWSSLKLLRSLPEDTRVYCGHEYTIESLEFAAHIEPENADVAARLADARKLQRAGEPTVPSTMGTEAATNPFLRADTDAMREVTGLSSCSAEEVFAELRRRKDRW